MERSRLEHLAPLSGLGFVLFAAAGVVIAMPGSPDFVGPPADYVRYFDQHHSDIMVGSLLGVVSVFFLIWFLGSLRGSLASSEGGDRRVTSIAVGGGLVAAAMVLMSFITLVLPALRIDDQGKLSGDMAAMFGDLANGFLGIGAPLAFGVMLAAVALLGFRHAAVPKWLSWVSAVMAVGLVVPVVSWAVVLAVPLWVGVMSVLMFRHEVGAAPVGMAARAAPAAT